MTMIADAVMTTDGEATVLEPKATNGFVETTYIKEVTKRAMTFIKAGIPVHLRGSAGTGKTTLALHLADMIGRPVIMIHGDEEFRTSDLVGGEHGYRMRKVKDNFIHSVLKIEEEVHRDWIDSRLTVACENGYTLIYDEFTRSRPEANNILLPVLQERIMTLPFTRRGPGHSYLLVHPDFRAIFTSNPQEYAGVYRSQDALRDRMVTLDLDHFDRETEIAITVARSGISRRMAEVIVDIVGELRRWRQPGLTPTVRSSIIIACTLMVQNAQETDRKAPLLQICHDVLGADTLRDNNTARQQQVRDKINELVEKHRKSTFEEEAAVNEFLHCSKGTV